MHAGRSTDNDQLCISPERGQLPTSLHNSLFHRLTYSCYFESKPSGRVIQRGAIMPGLDVKQLEPLFKDFGPTEEVKKSFYQSFFGSLMGQVVVFVGLMA